MNRPLLAMAWEVLGSMRFAVAILALVAVAASIGTVVEQQQALSVYVSRYGELQAGAMLALGLADVFHAGWFLSLLGFLALSTGLCIWRNTPKMLREFTDFKAHLALAQVRHLPGALRLEAVAVLHRRPALVQVLRDAGFRVRDDSFEGRLAITGHAGRHRRLGYIATHLAVVVICAGGLIDANLPLQWQLWTQQLRPADPAQPLNEVQSSPDHSTAGGGFRGSVQLVPGQRASHAAVTVANGYLARSLPVALELQSFQTLYHPDGRPRDFVSQLLVRDVRSGAPLQALRVSMNAPARVAGLSIYQSGLDDGGTRLSAELLEDGGRQRLPMTLTVGQSGAVLLRGQPWTVEPASYQPRNVLPESEAQAQGWQKTFLSGPRATQSRDLGPSLTTVLRDAAGQARRQTAYLQPIEWEGRAYAVIGLEADGVASRWLRLPLDAKGGLGDYAALVQALSLPASRARLAERLVGTTRADASLQAVSQVLDLASEAFLDRGWKGIRADRPLLADLLLRAGVQALRDIRPGLTPEQAQAFVRDTLLAYGDWCDAGRPPLLHPLEASPVSATVLQVTHAPGAPVVWLGMALLAIGVALMVLQREQRLWLRNDGPDVLVIGLLPPPRAGEAEPPCLAPLKALINPTRKSHETD